MPYNTPCHDYDSQHSSDPEVASPRFNPSCIDPLLFTYDSRHVRPNGMVTAGLDRQNKPPALPLSSHQGRASNGPHGAEYDDPRMYRTPPLPYFSGGSRPPTAITTTQNAMKAAVPSMNNNIARRGAENTTGYTNHLAAQEDTALTVREAVPNDSTPVVRKTCSSSRLHRNSGGGNHNNWRIVDPDDKRVAQYIQRWGHNRVASIRSHNRPGCTCRLDTGYLKRFDRGVVCGIRSAATNRDLLQGFIAQSQQVRSSRSPPKGNQEFFCANCGQRMTQWQSIKTHFPFCVLKFGNPNGYSWYDHPSMCITSRARYPGQP